MRVVTLWKLTVGFKQTYGGLEQFHVISALTTPFRVFSERLGHSDFVHGPLRFLMT